LMRRKVAASAGVQRCAVHDDGVAFYVAIKIEVRAVTGGRRTGVVLEDNDGGFDGVQERSRRGAEWTNPQ